MVDGSTVEDDDDGCQPEPQDIGDDPSPPRCQEGGALSALDDLSARHEVITWWSSMLLARFSYSVI